MRFLADITSADIPPASSISVRLFRAGAIGFMWLFAIGFIYLSWKNFTNTRADDFISYWAAGRLTLAGEPAAAYDVARHRAVEFTIIRFTGLMTFPYPPPFLMVVTPFALLPYRWALIAWVTVTAAFFALATRRTIETPYAFAHPSVLINAWIGQNGFLTTGIFAGGTALLGTRPFLAGTILGLLLIKPQLALLLPVAVIAARQWRAIAGATLSAGALMLAGVLLFGAASYDGFVAMVERYAQMMRDDSWPWNEFISVFAFLRYLGVDRTIAMAVHTIVAVAAAAATWAAWRNDWEAKVPALAAASLLVPPYLLTYDGLLMIIPMGFWLRGDSRLYLVGLIWLLCFLPVAFYFNLYRGPNTVPLAAMLFLGVVVIERPRLQPAPEEVGTPVNG